MSVVPCSEADGSECWIRVLRGLICCTPHAPKNEAATNTLKQSADDKKACTNNLTFRTQPDPKNMGEDSEIISARQACRTLRIMFR